MAVSKSPEPGGKPATAPRPSRAENICGQPSQDGELHVCMGLNSCAGQDVHGKATMAGTGECATVQHVCHGEGACRGQGGCGYAGDDYEQFHPGEQACRFNGSCASPINESRVFSGGPLKGKSVWQQARHLFEARMYAAGKAFGPAPGQGVPDDYFPEYDRLVPPQAGDSDKAAVLFRASEDNPRCHEGVTFPVLQAIVRNSAGRHLPYVQVTFTIPGGLSSVLYFKEAGKPASPTCQVPTDDKGVATAVPLYAGHTTPGDQWVTVTASTPVPPPADTATCDFHVTVLTAEGAS
ncbi:Ig-like domain-containing protein [Streptomyces albireticuli]|uniref:Ig-like domain-containing protein n=1 Tax=Streptomyces albireticuli TaxID=1940 RepID=UPI00367371F8